MTVDVCSVCGSPAIVRFNGAVLQAPICHKCERLFMCGMIYTTMPDNEIPGANIDMIILSLIKQGVMDPTQVIEKDDSELKP